MRISTALSPACGHGAASKAARAATSSRNSAISRWATVTRADVVEFLDDLEREYGLRHQVNRCRETLRAIFAYAIERDLVTVNPVVGVSKRKVEIPRDRTLTADELTAFWQAVEKLPELPRAYFRVVLLTGARRNEVGGMAWSELDLDADCGDCQLSATRVGATSKYHYHRRWSKHCRVCRALDRWYSRSTASGP